MNARALVGGPVLVDEAFRDDVAVLVDGTQVVAVCDARDRRLAAAARVDLDGRRLVPGYVDCQVNGGGGALFNAAPELATIRTIAAAHRARGTTALLPTLISSDPATRRRALAAVRAALAQRVPGVLGIHLEGPYLAAARRGVHDAAHFRAPDPAELEALAGPGAGVTLLTVAPEQVAPEQLRALTARGVIVAAGHTDADYACVRAALDAGLRGFTHLYNAMSPLTSRAPGAVGAALEDRASWCGLIVDGHHLHPAAVRVALAAKPRGKCFLVSDAMPPAAGGPDHFVLDGARIECRDGACRRGDGTLAGSCLDLTQAVRHTLALGVPLAEALRMASTYPAQFLGLGDRIGRIAAGYRADLLELDDDLTVHASWIGGEREAHG